jgi:hypothetical protein
VTARSPPATNAVAAGELALAADDEALGADEAGIDADDEALELEHAPIPTRAKTTRNDRRLRRINTRAPSVRTSATIRPHEGSAPRAA